MMRKMLIITAFMTVLSAYSQVENKPFYFVGKAEIESLPEKLYVDGVELNEIKSKYILVKTEVPLLTGVLIGRLGLKYCTIDFGQKVMLNEKGKPINQQKVLSVSSPATENNRLMSSSINFFNLLNDYGWEYDGSVGNPESFQFIFRKKD